jgi:DNA-binding CsgD family transcriptional regulator
MTIAAVNRLNGGQRDCLRLVLAHHNSKEIARELGVSPHTVDQRLRTAMRILDAQSRFEAARKFAAVDMEGQYQTLIYQMPDVEPPRKNERLGPSIGGVSSDKMRSVAEASNGAGGVAATVVERPEFRRRQVPVPRFRGEENGLGTAERLGWVLAIAIASALSFGGLIAGLEALSRLKG